MGECLQHGGVTWVVCNDDSPGETGLSRRCHPSAGCQPAREPFLSSRDYPAWRAGSKALAGDGHYIKPLSVEMFQLVGVDFRADAGKPLHNPPPPGVGASCCQAFTPTFPGKQDAPARQLLGHGQGKKIFTGKARFRNPLHAVTLLPQRPAVCLPIAPRVRYCKCWRCGIQQTQPAVTALVLMKMAVS